MLGSMNTVLPPYYYLYLHNSTYRYDSQLLSLRTEKQSKWEKEELEALITNNDSLEKKILEHLLSQVLATFCTQAFHNNWMATSF